MFVCLSVFPQNISKTDAVRINKLNIDMFHNECWKPIYFGVKSANKGRGHDAQKTVPVWVTILL